MATSGGALHTPPSGPPPSNPQSAPNLVGFDPKSAVPQQPIYLQRNDYLQFSASTNTVNISVTVDYRWLTPTGEIKEGSFRTPPINPSFQFTIPVYEGWLLSFASHINSGFVAGQWCYLQAYVARSAGTANIPVAQAVIWQGFISSQAGNGWPGTPTKEFTDGAGFLTSVSGATPAAGAEISEQVPSNRRRTLLLLTATLAASATVANRFPGFQIDDNTNVLFVTHTNVAQTAGTTSRYQITPGNQFYNDTQFIFSLPFPSLVTLKGLYHIKSNTVGLQAGDQWSAPNYLFIEWGSWDV